MLVNILTTLIFIAKGETDRLRHPNQLYSDIVRIHVCIQKYFEDWKQAFLTLKKSLMVHQTRIFLRSFSITGFVMQNKVQVVSTFAD